MMPELGVLALILALLVAVVQGTLPLAGATRQVEPWMRLARPCAVLQCLLSLLAFGILAHAAVQSDFSVLYVAANTHSQLPWIYRFTATWGSHEGSMLLWQTMLACWGCAVAWRSHSLPRPFAVRVLAVMGWISVAMLVFLLALSNPFARLVPAAPEGRDLNPLLQDPGMVSHPPLLYMGYVGFAVPFAFAIAALLSGRLDASWARWSRPWTLLAWSFLTLGILLGSAWAYSVLGWGGWWLWDPVENASFMPWLTGTALLHSLIVTDQRGAFRRWTALLAIAAFSLSLLGTFLVRSGVLTSVHAFAVDPGRGLYILVLMTLVVGGSLLLFGWRASTVASGGRFDMVSRESLLLVNNVLFSSAALAVLLGTLYPLALDVLRGDKISVGPPYFEAVFLPLVVPALMLMGVGPLAKWKRAPWPDLRLQMTWAVVLSAGCTVVVTAAVGRNLTGWTPLAAFGLVLGAWCLGTTLAHAWQRLRPAGAAPSAASDRQAHGGAAAAGRAWQRLTRQTGAWWGMLAAHAGAGIFVLGVTFASGFEQRVELQLAAGGTTEVGGLQFRLDGFDTVAGPNYDSVRATVTVHDPASSSRVLAVLHPEKRVFRADGTALSWPAIDTGVRRDLFVVLAEPADDDRWGMRVQVKPCMAWIWAGAALMTLGGLLAAADRRYRLVLRRAPAGLMPPAPGPHPLRPATLQGQSSMPYSRQEGAR